MSKIKVTIILKSGKDLPSLDIGGSSDPYVEILFYSPVDGQSTFKSKTIMKTLNPKWNETFTVEFTHNPKLQQPFITFKAFDYDRLTQHDSMGQVRLDFKTLKVGSNDLELNLPKGSLSVTVTVDKEYFEEMEHEKKRKEQEKLLEEENKKKEEEEMKKLEEKSKQEEKEALEKEEAGYLLKFSKLFDLKGFEHSIISIAETKDGNYIVASQGSIKVFDKKDGKCLYTFEGHTSTIRKLIKLKDDTFISCSDDKTIKIWNSEGKCLQNIKDPDAALDIVELPNGNIFTTGFFQNNFKIWDKNGSCLVKKDLDQMIEKLFLKSDGKIVTGDETGQVNVWKENGDLISSFKAHDKNLRFLKESKDGNIVTSSNDSIKIWNELGNLQKEIKIPNQNLSIQNLGNFICYSTSNALTVWDKSGKEINKVNEKALIQGLTSLKSGKLLSALYEGEISVRKRNGDLLQELKGNTATISVFYEAIDGKLVTGDKWGTILVWDLSQ